jgi:hypothetical protein
LDSQLRLWLSVPRPNPHTYAIIPSTPRSLESSYATFFTCLYSSYAAK